MDAELNLILTSANEKTQYDTYAKRLLSQKCVLACILTTVVDEFRGMDPKEAERFIEGEIHVGDVPFAPGLTNSEQTKQGNQIVGLNTVQQEIGEGVAVFDILFYARLRDGLSRIIVNLEAQTDEPSAYHILNRAIFYVSRQISSQKERDFTGDHFNDLKQVYSVWICMNMKECSWNYIHLTDESFLGKRRWRGNLDLLNIVLLGVPNEVPQPRAGYELHRLLSALFSVGLSWEERISILENEYHMNVRTEFGKELKEMCNLSQGILERGIGQGEQRMAELIQRLNAVGRAGDVMKAASSEEYRKKLYTEFGI
ncbi:MAG: Rpn family recombination-promoting nuclease/putative transposase [Lachnospiraceae bacterium]|nr:Rpn family recombination-promoting nuclease/putative transposase [Lachnospiraceae bacterium]